ncbi:MULTISPECIES: class I SAM-dependent methyltransferase [unclassified Streptomyces]|uniref:class I SAM-dependent methyltransferase n=1 Tax=unclassified Streptomyces TaxID=2593676 RepID=UPI000369A325|nr:MULTISPECIES: class I SAM-dependent methyltransferase [unclassified Streptomyces]MYT29255.1 methyltransferase domain-containing protein [Streptomyces sp. SID8354]
MTSGAAPENEALALSSRMFMAMLATQELLTSYLGIRLGLYEALAAGPATTTELAERVGISPRYAREWLEQQAVAHLVTVEDRSRPATARRYVLPAAHARVLTVSDDPLSMAALTALPLGGVARALPELLEAYRSGRGVPDERYGADWREGHSGANRSLFRNDLPGWLKSAVPGTHERLCRPGARIADVACGVGWAALALAGAYPDAEVDGIDLDAESIAMARRHAEAVGVADRTRFVAGDAAGGLPEGRYDLVCLFDSLHEIGKPEKVLRACRALRADGGQVLVLDAKVADVFSPDAGEVERFQYATSVLHCLPAALCDTDDPETATGTVLRRGTLRGQALRAGFTKVRTLPVEDRFHRLYALDG